MKLYNLIFEESTLDRPEADGEDVVVGQRTRLAPDSVDDQIDALILRYESASIRAEEKISVTESLKNLNLKILLEQEEPPADMEEAEPPAEGEPAEDTEESPNPEGSEAMGVTEPADEQEVPDLDVDAFAGRVVRLVMNYKNLLRIEDAIINRVKHFLDENYGDAFVNKFLDTIEQQYGLSTEEFAGVEYDKDEEFAVGAFAGGTGGLGGGG